MHAIFETKRTLVRRITADDIGPMLRVYGDADAMRWVGDGSPITEDEAERWIVVTNENYRKRGYGMFAIESGETDAVIGFCGLVHPGGQPEPELKYALDRAVWGGGLATEVAGAMLEYARSVLGLAAVIATIARENAASIRIVERLGMTRSTPRVEDDGSITEVYTIQLNTTGSTDALG